MSISAYQDPFLSEKLLNSMCRRGLIGLFAKGRKKLKQQSFTNRDDFDDSENVTWKSIICISRLLQVFFFTRKVCIRQPLTRLIWEITRKIWKSFVTVVQCKSRSRRGLDDKTIVFQCQIDKVVMFLSLSSSRLFKRAKKCISNDSASCRRNVFHLFDKEVSNARVHSCVTNE